MTTVSGSYQDEAYKGWHSGDEVVNGGKKVARAYIEFVCGTQEQTYGTCCVDGACP